MEGYGGQKWGSAGRLTGTGEQEKRLKKNEIKGNRGVA